MKILYVVHDFFPKFFGGTERYVLNIAKQMQRMGVSVKVMTYGVADSADMFTARGSILYRTYAYEGVPIICIRHRTIPVDQGFRLSDDMLDEMKGILRDEGADLVHVAHPMRLSAAITAAWNLSIPVVLTITDFWLLCVRGRFFKPDYSLCNSADKSRKCISQCGVDRSVFERNEKARKLFESVAVRIAPSRFLIEIFRKNGWTKPIVHLNHGVDYHYVNPMKRERRNGPVIFAYMGVVGRFKGINLLVDSFRRIDSPGIKLHIYGNCVGDDGTIEFLHEAEAADPRITVMGRYDHADLPSILNSIDIITVPSTTLESYGLVVVESLAYGIPVIASDIVGSAYEYIKNGENGLIFPMSDTGQLARIIEEISEDPDMIDAMREKISPPSRLEEEVFNLHRIYRSLLK